MCEWAKAEEGVKRLEMQPRGTLRRRGRGTVGQPVWEQGRPVFAPAVRHRRCQLGCGLGEVSPISGVPVKWASAERESEWSVVPTRSGQQNPGGGKGPRSVGVPNGGKRG